MTKSVAKLAEDGKVSIRYQKPHMPLFHSKCISSFQYSFPQISLAFSCRCRNARRESMKQLDKHEKDGDLSEDEKKALADSIQELTDDDV